MSAVDEEQAAVVDRMLEWLYTDELRHSRMIWRIEADRRAADVLPYAGAWFDPAGAALIDLSGHPRTGSAARPWLQVAATDADALELLLGVRAPAACEVLVDCEYTPAVAALGSLTSAGELEVHTCPPGELGRAALPYDPTRLTLRHRAIVAEDGWRPEDLAAEQDEDQGGVRWAIIREGHLVARLLLQRITGNLVEISDVHTHPDFRRRGYGAALVQSMVRRLHERGLTASYSVHPSNHASLALAAAVGFQYAFRWERVLLYRT